ncbi:CoA-transferase family III [Penicillium canariense]|uniref:CoA-transferase family III n=1 Tax=Penicillium canariense TaxID=189055 RepID=A0A9W9HNE9_9EURO|nr:CoA-transferase family III [Penicillium canariense]KAJ5150839.1 CoA-transferase family III [Penicillium canariense]
MRFALRPVRALGQASTFRAPTHLSTRCYSSVTSNGHRSPPLAGITVVSLEQAIAAPFCTRQLADLGARVIKVERPCVGDFARQYDDRVNGMSSHFVWTNRSKESLALDLKDRNDHAVLMRLLGQADVLVQNLAPGASARLGLSHDVLKEKHPSLIVCDISGYGQDGPYRDKKAYDLLIQSEAGMLSVTGTGTEPVKVGISIADIAAGMYAYTNILSALLQRGKDGQGCRIDISMLESMVEWMSFPMYYAFDGAAGPVPAGASHAAIYPYGPFEASDGQIMLGIQNEREWAKFCSHVLCQPDLTSDSRFSNNTFRSKNRDELKAVIDDTFSRLTAAETIARLEVASIANANLNDMHGVWKHAQLEARDRWVDIQTPTGAVQALLPPGSTKSADQGGYEAQMGSVPEVGEHNKAILAELGLTEKND